jgi:hypothetical protein
MDHVTWQGRTAKVQLFQVFYPPLMEAPDILSPTGVQLARIDCDAKTYQSGGGVAFDVAERLLLYSVASSEARPIRDNTLESREVSVICDGVAPPAIVNGHIAAIVFGQQALGSKLKP